jgi:nitroreductase
LNEVLKAIANRRSLRNYKDEQIKDEELNAILEAGLMAPTGHNDQPWYFTVIQNKALLKEISDGAKAGMKQTGVGWIVDLANNEKMNIFYNSQTAVIVCARKDAVTPLADACAAIENMLIAAESLQIGSCWVGFAKFYFTGPESYKRLYIPDGYEMQYALVLGYKPDGVKMVQPPRKYPKYYSVIK